MFETIKIRYKFCRARKLYGKRAKSEGIRLWKQYEHLKSTIPIEQWNREMFLCAIESNKLLSFSNRAFFCRRQDWFYILTGRKLETCFLPY